MTDSTLRDKVIAYLLDQPESHGPRIQVSPEPPLFSVMVPVYNHAHFLPATLDTILAQTYPHWEAVVVNDGSTDGTAEVIASYAARDPRIRPFHKTNGGVSTALNLALRECRGRWIGWLSSDDFYTPNKLALHVEAFKAMPEARFFHTHFRLLEHENNKLVDHILEHCPPPPPALQTLNLYRWNYVNGVSIMIQRSLFQEVGDFVECLRWGQDFNMWLRMSLRTPFYHLKDRTVVTRIHLGSGTSQFPEAGHYDSMRSLLTLLNHSRFEDLVPFANLHEEASLKQVLNELITVSLEKQSYMYQGVGYITPLLTLFDDWVRLRARPQLQAMVRSHFTELSRVLQQYAIPEEVRAAFWELASPQGRPAPEKDSKPPVDHFRILRTRAQNEPSSERAPISNYLERLKKLGTTAEEDLRC